MNQSSIFPSREHREKLVAKLKELGIETVVVGFSGSGDSGAVDDICATPVPDEQIKPWTHGGNILRQHKMYWVTSSSAFENGSWVRKKQDQEMTIYEVLETTAYQALEESRLDWYNDAGGQGEFTMAINGDSVDIDLRVGINYTHTNQHRFELGNDWVPIERLPLP